VALPVAAENCPPDFVHHGRDSLPSWERDGASVTVVAGQAFGETSPVRTCSALCYVDVKLEAGAKIPLANEFVNLGIYPVSGAVSVSSVILPVGTLGLVDSQGEGVDLEAHDVSRVLLLGGAELEDRRYLWWNFVASSPERIEQAKVDWRDHRFAPVPGDSERMPMPGE
jgi:redox-sensitive bicupin YhaK (pirin superfamily)